MDYQRVALRDLKPGDQFRGVHKDRTRVVPDGRNGYIVRATPCDAHCAYDATVTRVQPLQQVLAAVTDDTVLRTYLKQLLAND